MPYNCLITGGAGFFGSILKEELLNLRNAYKLIQSRTTTLTNVANMLEEEYPNDKNIIRLVEFIRTSKRGIYLGRYGSSAGSEE